MGLVGLLITLIVEVVMLYWPGRLLIKIIVLVDFKGCQIFLITPSFICISMRNLFCLFNTVELFFDGLIDKTEAIKRLRYEKPNLQICFCTEKALSLLHFEGSEIL